MKTQKGVFIGLLALVLVFALWGGGALAQGTPTAEPDRAVVRFILFYSDTCPHCHKVMTEYLPTVYEKYGDQVEYKYLNIHNNTDLYMTMLAVETKLGVPPDRQGYVPTLVIGDKVLIGGDEIPAKLEGYIDEYLAQGGVDFVSLEDLPTVVVPTPPPSVQLLVFLDPNHADFDRLNSLITSLGQKYGSSLQPYAVDISQAENAARLQELHRALGVEDAPPGTPEVLIGRTLLVGIEEIESRLPDMVAQALAEGGSAIPPWEELVGQSESTPPTAGGEPPPIHMAYFEKAGCQECARATYDLQVVQERYPQVVVERFAIEDNESKELNAWLCKKYGVPEEKYLTTPMIFVGQDVLVGEEATLQNMLAAVEKYAATGAEPTWSDFEPGQGQDIILGVLGKFGVLGVLVAGLVDGLNPCAFATLVFFISYLTFTGRRGRDILFVGLSFALGVFVTYLLVGVGLLTLIQSLSYIAVLGQIVYAITILLCVVLAIFTFRDFTKARRGQHSEMTIKLPVGIRRRINKVIRENAKTRAFVAMAFVTGFIVSLLELACTGQVYLPAIMYTLSVPELADKAFFYLLLYNIMFILPLIVVFVLAYFGTSSEQLGNFVNRHTATIKFLTGLVFIGLAMWMTWALAHALAIVSPWNRLLMAGVPVVVAVGVAVLLYRDKRAPAKATARKGGRA